MESDLGKLFIGGISWNTDEDRLKEYFGSFGEVVEAVIMRDRTTGRARGFGFIVFADPAVAERVVAEKHVIDGRTVEAKKAVPRDDQQMINRNVVQGSSPVPGRTKKIFVGGLASTVSETDFKAYFDQFGTITDVVVMYDHNTQRPRGFGFITFDSEESVERVLHKTFHELNGKMVEVKRAVPKELSPGPARSPITGYNYGFNRPTSFLSNYGQGYNLSSLGGYGVRMDGRFNPLGNRSALSPFNSLGYGMGMNLDPTLSLSIGGATNFNNNNLGYRRVSSPYRYSNPIGYGGATVGNDSPLGASTWNVWGNSGINSVANVSSPPPYMSNGGGRFGVFGNRGSNWGSSPLSPQGDGNVSGYAGGATGFNGGENSYRLSGGGFGRNNGSAVSTASSFAAPAGGYAGSYGDLYQTGSVYGDTAWRSASPEIDGSSSFDNALGDVSEVAAKGSEDYIGGYSIGSRKTNRGIAA